MSANLIHIVTSAPFNVYDKCTNHLTCVLTLIGVLRAICLIPIHAKLMKLQEAPRIGQMNDGLMRNLQDVSEYLGHVGRDLGSIGSLMYAFHVIMPVCDIIMRRVHRTSMETLSKTGIFLHLCDAHKSHDNRSKVMMSIVDSMRKSYVIHAIRRDKCNPTNDCDFKRATLAFERDNMFTSMRQARICNTIETYNLDRFMLSKCALMAGKQERWRSSIDHALVKYYALILTNWVVSSNVVSYGLHLLAYRLSRHKPQMSRLDRLGMCIHILSAYWASRAGLKPLALMFVGVIDVHHAIHDLQQSFAQILAKRHRAYRCELSQSSARKSTRNESCNLDERATILYIKFRLFMSDVRASMSYVRIVIERSSAFMLSAVAIMACCRPSAPTRSHINMSLIIALYLWLIVMVSLVPVAALSVRCHKLVKSVWSMIAQEPVQSCCGAQDSNRINLHTIELWSRLVGDKRQLDAAFTTKIFGLFRVDYGNIAQLNFITISALLFYWIDLRARASTLGAD